MSTTNTNIQIGQNFANRFKIIKCLGIGGMGEVFLAEDLLLNNSQIALKFLHQDLSSDQKQVDRFLREVLLTRKVSHNNVVKTFDASLLDNQLYFVMEYVEGLSLKDIIQDTPTSIAEGVNYLKQIAQGLEAIHQAEIIHRDLKPANIMLQHNGQIKIADFGIARPDNSELTNHNEVIGSSHFMSPEAWRGDNISYKTDIYSLGIIAFQIFTGQLPFDGNTSAQIMFKHLAGNTPNAQDLNSEIPAWLNNLILDMLSSNPELRPELAQIIASLESEGVRKRAATKTNINIAEIFPEPSGYVSTGLDRPDEFSSIWDPNSNIVINKDKAPANPNFGTKNLEERTIKGKIKNFLNKFSAKKSKEESHWIQFFVVLIISILLAKFALPMTSKLNEFFPEYSNSAAISSLRLLFNSLLVAIFASWPILVIDSLFNTIGEAIKKLLKLTIICFSLIILVTTFYTWQLNLLTTTDKGAALSYLLSAIKLANPKAIISLLESSLLLPVASYYDLVAVNKIPTFRPLSINLSTKIIPYYFCCSLYFLAFSFLIRDTFRQVYQQFRSIYLIPCLFVLIYSLELLVFLLVNNDYRNLTIQTEYVVGFFHLDLSWFQIYCAGFNWLVILILLKLILPLLRTKKTF